MSLFPSSPSSQFIFRVCLPVCWLALTSAAGAQDAIAPVRSGDEIEIRSFSKWYPGTVESFQDGKATVRYQSGSFERTGEFSLKDIRFPYNEGPWLLWKDASGKFKVEARFVSRTETDVTIRKTDGDEVTIPIKSLHSTLRKHVARAPIASDMAAPVHEGDQVQVNYYSKWYDGIVKSVRGSQISVEYSSGTRTTTRDFTLKDIRYPNGEGPWIIWKDASGKFKVEARYIARTADEVTIRKTDGKELTIPISSLHSSLRKLIAKTPITSELNKIDGAIPIRVGDRVQVKSWSSWYDGVVKEVKVGLATVEYTRGTWGKKTENFELKDMRYPNGEGPWREWSDTSGNFQVIARYLSRSEDHVTILKEDGKEATVPIEKLNAKLKKRLRETPIIARRPPLVSLSGGEKIGDVAGFAVSAAERAAEARRSAEAMKAQRLSASTPADAAVDLTSLTIQTGSPVSRQTVRLPPGGVAIAIEPQSTIDTVVPIGGSEGWVAVSTRSDTRGRNQPMLSRLHWASLSGRKGFAGPNFFPDQKMIAYSARQSRLVMYSVQGTWKEPYQLSTYRIAPGTSTAKPEFTINIPKKKNTFNREPLRATLVGKNHMLFGYGGKVSLWDLESRNVVYQVGDLNSHFFRLSIDHRYFAVRKSRTTIALHELQTGRQIGQGSWEGYGDFTACFSQDGKSLMAATSSGFYRWDLAGTSPVRTLPIGGVGISNNGPLADVGGGWLVAGPQVYSSGLGLIVWRYDGSGVHVQHQEMLGRQMLVAATAGNSKGKSILIGVATVPHQDAIEQMKKVDPESVRMLKRGSRVRIDTSVDSRILAGLRAAARKNGWTEDPGAEAVLTGSAKRGETQQLTYRSINFGTGESGEETHSVSPWIQTAQVTYNGQNAWRTSIGGVPFSVRVGEGQSLGGELQKSSDPSYSLFENLKVPEEVIYPRYQRGLGRTMLTVKGFVDSAN